MRKNNYVRLLGLGIICYLLSNQPVLGQSSVLILNGNTVSPSGAKKDTSHTSKKTTTTTKSTATPAAATTHTAKPAPVAAKPAPKRAPVVQQKPKPAAPAPKPVVKSTPKPVPVAKNKKGHNQQVDYIKRVQFVHNLVSRRFQQNTVDSISDVNHYMLDSIRVEITKHKDKDSINFLQTALANGVNDSLIIVTINNLVNSANVNELLKNSGSLNAYCIDLTTQAPMDSVKVSIFSHDSLIATAFSGNDGFSKIPDIKPGEYSLSFSKTNYTPFSDRWVKITANNVTYLEMPLTETPRFYIPRFSAQIWAMIIVGIISVFVLVYSIIRRLGRVA